MVQFLHLVMVNLDQQKLAFITLIVILINCLKAKYLMGCLFVILVTTENVLIQIIYGLELQKIIRKTWQKKADQT